MKLFKIRNTTFQYLKFWLKSFILLAVLFSLYSIFIWYFSFFGLPIPASIYHPLCLLSFLTHSGLYDWPSKPLLYWHSDLPNIYQNSKIGSMTKSDIATSRQLSITYVKPTFIETGTPQIHGFQLLLCCYHQKPFNLIVSHHFYPTTILNFPIFNQTSYSTTRPLPLGICLKNYHHNLNHSNKKIEAIKHNYLQFNILLFKNLLFPTLSCIFFLSKW